MSSRKLQAILFDKKRYNTTKARRWLRSKNYVPIKRVHKTLNYLRYRLREPSKSYDYRTIVLGKGIKAILIIS